MAGGFTPPGPGGVMIFLSVRGGWLGGGWGVGGGAGGVGGRWDRRVTTRGLDITAGPVLRRRARRCSW